MNLNGTPTDATQAESHSEILVSPSEVEAFLSCTPEQAERIVKQIDRLEGLKGYFKAYPEDNARDHYSERLAKAERALNYERPYRIAIVAKTGAGKSSFANAVLDRDLLFTRMGRPVTGTALEISQTADSTDAEYAEVFYRSTDDIRHLIQKELCVPFDVGEGLEEKVLRAKLDEDLVKAIEDVDVGFAEQFPKIRGSIVDIIKQYIHHGEAQANAPEKYDLACSDQQERLDDLINENSEQNQGESRRIGLIKKVSYHICPKQGENSTLQLPRNACLVDLPGIDATPLHDIIIKADIREADAVVLMFEPVRLDIAGETEMIQALRENIGLNRSDQIFPLLNKREQILTRSDANEVLTSMDNIVRSILQMDSPPKRTADFSFFPVSTGVARLASKTIEGTELTSEESDVYANFCNLLKVDANEPSNVLRATRIPEVVDAINKLAANNIETRIHEATVNLDSTAAQLKTEHDEGNFESVESLQQSLTEATEVGVLQEIENRETNMRAVVRVFRQKRLKNRKQLNESLKGTIQKACDSIDEKLVAGCLPLWEAALHVKENPVTASEGREIETSNFITAVNMKICDLLSEGLGGLASEVARDYRNAFKQDKVREDLLEEGTGLPGAEDTFSEEKIDGIIVKLEASLEQFCTRVGVAVMLDPENYFLREDEQPEREDEQPEWDSEEKSVLNTLKDRVTKAWEALSSSNASSLVETLPRGTIPTPSEVDLKAIAAAVRACYYPLIESRVVTDLLNIYAYEMFLTHKVLDQSIEKLIRASEKAGTSGVSIFVNSEKVEELQKKMERADQRVSKRRHLEEIR